MKYGLILIIIVGSLIGCAHQKSQEQIHLEAEVDKLLTSGQSIYIAHTLWFENPDRVEAINFKGLPMKLDAGTEIDHIDLFLTNPQENIFYSHIDITLLSRPEPIQLIINQRYQRNGSKKLDILALLTRTFTTQSFDELTKGLKPEEIKNIKRGTIQQGMSKKAVLMSWGYPPLHGTLNIDEDQWAYWKKRSQREFVDFDEYGKVFYSTWYGKGGNFVDIIE